MASLGCTVELQINNTRAAWRVSTAPLRAVFKDLLVRTPSGQGRGVPIPRGLGDSSWELCWSLHFPNGAAAGIFSPQDCPQTLQDVPWSLGTKCQESPAPRHGDRPCPTHVSKHRGGRWVGQLH